MTIISIRQTGRHIVATTCGELLDRFDNEKHFTVEYYVCAVKRSERAVA